MYLQAGTGLEARLGVRFSKIFVMRKPLIGTIRGLLCSKHGSMDFYVEHLTVKSPKFPLNFA